MTLGHGAKGFRMMSHFQKQCASQVQRLDRLCISNVVSLLIAKTYEYAPRRVAWA